jgi:citronellol/citronellal dehydrogenase
MYELGGEQMMAGGRKPEIMGDAAYAILTQSSRLWTGRFFIDDEVLMAAGVRNFGKYDAKPGEPLITDFFVETLPGMRDFPH